MSLVWGTLMKRGIKKSHPDTKSFWKEEHPPNIKKMVAFGNGLEVKGTRDFPGWRFGSKT